MRGLYSQGGSVGWESSLFLWAPNVNPFRDPRWGRGQEVPSEEPLVCAEFAAQYIPGLQGEIRGSDGQPFLKTVATAKHFFDYDLEGAPTSDCSPDGFGWLVVASGGFCSLLTARVRSMTCPIDDGLKGVPGGPTDRQNINVNVSKRDQVEYFSPPFEAAVKRGRTRSVMCSYNAVNGVPACFTSAMLNGKMRGEWGFEGFVVSDCDALSDGASTRYIETVFNGSLAVQAQQAIRAGTDLNCGQLYGEQVEWLPMTSDGF